MPTLEAGNIQRHLLTRPPREIRASQTGLNSPEKHGSGRRSLLGPGWARVSTLGVDVVATQPRNRAGSQRCHKHARMKTSASPEAAEPQQLPPPQKVQPTPPEAWPCAVSGHVLCMATNVCSAHFRSNANKGGHWHTAALDCVPNRSAGPIYMGTSGDQQLQPHPRACWRGIDVGPAALRTSSRPLRGG